MLTHRQPKLGETATESKTKPSFARKLFSWGIDSCLICLASVGCYFAIQSSRRKSELEFHLNQLVDRSEAILSSPFAIADVDRIYVKAIETGKPLEFAWRVYLPSGFKNVSKVEFPNGSCWDSSMTPLPEPIESIVRFKIKLMGEFAICEKHWLGKVSVFPADLSNSSETWEYLESSNFSDAIT